MTVMFGPLMTLIVFSLFCVTTLIYVIYYYPHFFRGFRKFDKQISLKEFNKLVNSNHLPEFIIQITTKGGEMITISSGLKKLDSVILQLPRSMRSKIQIDLLTEQKEDEIVITNLELDLKINVIIVPENYQTTNGTKLKARALQYMNEIRKESFQKNGKELKNVYIVHFDAESTVSLESLRTIIGSVLKDKSKTIFQGPIFYSNGWLSSGLISRQMESLRPWNCYECYSLTSRGIPYHLHGSNIIVRGDTEAAIGWDFGKVRGFPVVAEDLFFGIMGYLIFGPEVFGWHGARMIEQPAFKLQDSIKQRVRWIRGSLQALEVVKDWSEYRSYNERKKGFLIFRMRFKLIFYAFGFIPSIITLVSFIYLIFVNLQGFFGSDLISDQHAVTKENVAIYYMPMLPAWMIVVTIIGAILWLISIQIGLYHNLKSMNIRKLSKFKEHILILLISPIATLIDTGTAFFTLISWSLGDKKAVWEVTPKLLET
ncbi:MAG: glycosyltransferase family 2 protein [Candidatus Kariarchaeaceae archaeon]